LLYGKEANFFTRIDTDFDHFTARYTEHIFRDAASYAADRSVSNSWKLLGKGILTSFTDLFLAVLLWNFFIFRFHVLWISTPFRLLSEKSKRGKSKTGVDTKKPLHLPQPAAKQWISGGAPSVSEHTTERLQEYRPVQHSSDEH